MGIGVEQDILLQEILAQLTAIRKANELLTEQLRKKDAEIERLNHVCQMGRWRLQAIIAPI